MYVWKEICSQYLIKRNIHGWSLNTNEVHHFFILFLHVMLMLIKYLFRRQTLCSFPVTGWYTSCSATLYSSWLASNVFSALRNEIISTWFEFGVLVKYWRASEIWQQLHWRVKRQSRFLAYLGEPSVCEGDENWHLPFASLTVW